MTEISNQAVAADLGGRQGEVGASLRGQVSWALYEFARSPYLALIYIYVFGPYFANSIIGDPVHGQELWSLANTIVGFIVAMLAPVLGAIADKSGPRKPWIATISFIMAAGCIALWWAKPEGGLPVFVILGIIVTLAGGFLLSEVFHNSMLPTLAAFDDIGRLSGLGISANNFGALISLLIVLFGVALPASGVVQLPFLPDSPLFGLDSDAEEHNRVSGPFAGVWLLIFTLPLLLWTPDRKSTGISATKAVKEGLRQLRDTIKKAREIKNIVLYLVARMLYNDAKVASLAYFGLYASGIFGWGLAELLLAGLVLTPFGIFGGFFGGWLDTTFGSKRAIQISVGGSALIMLSAVSFTPTRIFFFLPVSSDAAPLWSFPYFQTVPEALYLVSFMMLGAFITAAFTNSRTMMARISPKPMISQFFGLYALSGTATAFLGHAMVGAFTKIFESQRAGFASLIILLLAGLILMHWVKEERAEIPETA